MPIKKIVNKAAKIPDLLTLEKYWNPINEVEDASFGKIRERIIPTTVNGFHSPSNKIKNEETCQKKISDFYPVRRSNRTPIEIIKKKEKEKLISEILDISRELDEAIFKVVNIEGKGRGVIAGHNFKRGDFMVEYAGERIEIKTAKHREETYKANVRTGCYMYYFKHGNKNYCIDATEETGRIGRLINHSRMQPNCHTRVVEVADQDPRLILVALKKIEAGSELLYDYGDRNKESLQAHPWLAL